MEQYVLEDGANEKCGSSETEFLHHILQQCFSVPHPWSFSLIIMLSETLSCLVLVKSTQIILLWKERISIQKISPQIGLLGSTNDWCGKNQLIVGGGTPGQVILSCMKMQAKKAMKGKPVSIVPQWPLLSAPRPKLLPCVLPWIPSVMDCVFRVIRWHKACIPHFALEHALYDNLMLF